MKKQNKKEEIQSRREFFKKAAKAALPILGVALLVSNPIVAKATETPMSCRYGCAGTCTGGCAGMCTYTCTTVCFDDCINTCHKGCEGCKGTCVGTCRYGCEGVSY